MGNRRVLGTELVLDLVGCDPELLDNWPKMRRILRRAAVLAGATPVKSFHEKFEPQGITGGWVLSESSILVHSWPEQGYAGLNFHTCGSHTDPRRARHYLVEAFGATGVDARVLKRGPVHKPVPSD